MSRISLSSLSRLCRRVGTSIEAGVDVRTVWGGEATRARGEAATQLNVIKDQVADGHTVAEAMRATKGYFPPLVCEMVEAGEFSGRLGEVFHQLADHYDNLLRLRRSFLAGIWWP
jgi:type IV pilus assembly protein PilC